MAKKKPKLVFNPESASGKAVLSAKTVTKKPSPKTLKPGEVATLTNSKGQTYYYVKGTDGKVNTQYYYGIDGVDANDLFVDFTVDSSCLKFDTVASARKYSARRR